ncbi:MAG: DUF4910 domain-containing protein, partial [Acidobacteriota bacterium]
MKKSLQSVVDRDSKSTGTGAAWAREDLVRGLRQVVVEPGDTVFFQVCSEPLGSARGASTDGELCQILEGALREAVGPNGTILTPSYTFSFCRQQVFDVAESPTVRGPWNTFTPFPDHLRRLPGAIRSRDPIFSTAGLGPRAAQLLTGLPPVCLGEDSVHARLRKVGGKIVIVGVGLYEAIFRHYVESVTRVPWRYDKLFTGVVRENGKDRREGWLYNVRILASNGDPAGEALERLSRDLGICRAAPLGDGEILCVDSEAFFELTTRELRRDPWFTARGPAGDPLAIEEARTEANTKLAPLAPNASMSKIIESLWKLPRDLVSNGYDAALRALSSQVPMTIHEYRTGTECWTWIV